MLDLVLIFTATVVLVAWFMSEPKGLPPGPPRFPILGSLPFIELPNIHLYLEKVRPRYGPVIYLKMGLLKAVAFCGAAEVREVFKHPEFQGRPDITITSTKAKKGIILTEGPFWSAQRRFTVRHLRDFGFGKSISENLILDEIQEFFNNILKDKKQVQVTQLFNASAINVLWAIMAGERLPHDDAKFNILLDALFNTFRSGGFTTTFAFYRRNIRKVLGWPEPIECEDVLIDFIQNAIDEHKTTMGSEPRDFIDSYLQQMKAAPHDLDFNEHVLKSICIDLFTAGAESVGNTLGFSILYLVLHPEWQLKIWEEIQANVGDGLVDLRHRAKLHQTQAFLAEVERINTVATLTIPRRTTSDVMYKGHFIPKDTFIILSIWSVFMDKHHWGDPKVFRPERFICNGEYVKDDWLITFGAGPRQCPGETLARNIIFLFVANLVKELVMGLPAGHDPPTTECVAGFTTAPQPFEMTLQRRRS